MTFRPDAGDSARPDDRQLSGLMAELRGALDDIELGILDRANGTSRRWSMTAAQVVAQGKGRRRDGFPATGGPGGNGGGLGYSNPVASMATAADPPEVVRARSLLAGLERMRQEAHGLVQVLVDATPAQQHPDRPAEGCRNCSRPGKPEPIYRGGSDASERCRWCYDFWLLWKVDAPEPILKLRRERKRITENVIRAEIEQVLVG